ncbi:MAG: ATPase [Candidatus Margulisiibacteriota bacterium]|nr:MAG: ATPase [Candidatus Margulisbacteria bacterium GWD2_39_127]PZM80147.1 MAG: ATPase [Candidatus Margulisiibacteriota bacterium]HAR63121.1 ATPase [Candidatus Margulisiibacteriota bacterium]HCY37167.1 ATPase [Candidatus Margulisiibacteriota bacterium]
MKNYFNLSEKEVLEILNVDIHGLSDAEVEKRKLHYGYNELNAEKKISVFQVFLSQFADFLVLILLVAGIVSILLGDIESAAVIFAVTLLNAFLGMTQHIRAEKSLESLKSLAAPVAKVRRNGAKVEIPSREVVVGDLLFLDAGDYVAADGRIIENYNLQVNESSLTGESVSIIKSIDIIRQEELTVGDRVNMVFSGSLITYGRAVVAVTGTGMNTELGNVAALLETAQEKKTPLQVSLDKFGKKLAFVILALCIIIFLINISRGYALGESFLFAIALAVAAIPEALSSIVTIVLAFGTQKMAKEHAIVRNLHAVESLGSVSVICSDKTGTLTQNKMVVEKLYVNSKIINIVNSDRNEPESRKLAQMCVLCNDAVIQNGQSIGDPTEIALVTMAKHYTIDEIEYRKSVPRLSELPFDSDRKLMSTLHAIDGKLVMVTKGAVDVVLKRAQSIEVSNVIRRIGQDDLDNIGQVNHEFSLDGLRVLALAYKQIEARELTLDDESDLIFIGLVAMQDPPRIESKQAVEACIQAGIKPVMITGDHKTTASAIAQHIGILKPGDKAIEGAEINKMSDEVLKSEVSNISVYARVSPEHKIKIVRAWQERGHVVAMTGDGVNDAPALKQSNIGIAMGKVGTEVAKEASSIVLTDDNFATIVKAISNGRSIYSNIKHSIQFLFSGNMAGILAVLYTSVAGLPLPFTVVQLLFINLVTDSMPAIAIGLEPPNPDVMKESPRDINEPILTRDFLVAVVAEGALIAACTLAAFYYGLSKEGIALASTMAFSTLTIARLLHGFNCRSTLPLYKIGLFSNKYQWFAVTLGSSMVFMVLTIKPLGELFKVDPSVINELHVIAGYAVIPLIIVQLYKTIAYVLKK